MQSVDIIYLSYRSIDIHLQTCFSIVSLLASFGQKYDPAIYKIFVYTDKPEQFKAYPVQCEMLSAATANDWMGPEKYFFRLKPKTLQHHCSQHKNAFFFVDSDTYFTGDPSEILQKISPHFSLMDEDDGNPWRHGDFKIFYRKHGDLLRSFFPKISNKTWQMYNSGAIGMHPSLHHLLPKVIAFNDTCVKTGSPIHTFEQFAFTLYLAQNSKLHEAKPFLRHYFAHKAKILELLKNTFQAAIFDMIDEQKRIFAALKNQLPECFKRTIFERLQVIPKRLKNSIMKRIHSVKKNW